MDSQPLKSPLHESQIRWLVPFVVLLLSAAVYLPSLDFGFVSDDSQQIVLNQARFTWHSIPSFFTTDVWSYIYLFKSNYYRPIFMLWLMLNYQVFGISTLLWHGGAILAHLTATLLVYCLALRLTARRLTAGAAALLFGVHPIHVEAVSWLSGSTETVFATLALGTLLCRLQGLDPAAKYRGLWRAAELGLFALAIFAKETAVVLPALLIAWEWLLPSEAAVGIRRRARAAVASILPHLGIVLIYVVARYHALKSFAPLTRDWSVRTMLYTWPSALALYLRQLVIPFQYSLFYPINAVRHFSAGGVLAPLAVVLGAAGALLWFCWRSPVRTACAALLVLPILPVLNLRVFPFDDFAHDRYAYLPSVGLCILAAIAGEELHRHARKALLAIAVAGLATVAVWTSRYWNDNLTLYTHGIQVAPESTIAQEYLGQELVEEERWADALPLLKAALVHDSISYELYARIAKCYLGLDDPDEAISYLQDAIALAPHDPEAYLDLAVIEFNHNQLAPAETLMRQALALRPAYSPVFSKYHYRMARILEREGKWADALAEYQAELNENPGFADAESGLGRMRNHIAGIQ